MAIPEFVNIATLNKKLRKSWSRGFVKSRQKNGRDSRSRETEVGEKIAVTSWHACHPFLWLIANLKQWPFM